MRFTFRGGDVGTAVVDILFLSLLGNYLVRNAPRVNGNSRIVPDAAEPRNIFRGGFHAEQSKHLAITVLLHHVNSPVAADKIKDLPGKRKSPHAAITHRQL